MPHSMRDKGEPPADASVHTAGDAIKYQILSPRGVSEIVAELCLQLAASTGCSLEAIAPVVQKLTGFRFTLERLDVSELAQRAASYEIFPRL